jgi:hypothetical protein
MPKNIQDKFCIHCPCSIWSTLIIQLSTCTPCVQVTHTAANALPGVNKLHDELSNA